MEKMTPEEAHAQAVYNTATAKLIQANALSRLADALVDVVALVKEQLVEEAKAKAARAAKRERE